MEVIRLSQELKDKPVISVTNGKIIAKVEDLLVDPNTRTVTALLYTEGNLLSRTVRAIPSTAIQIWGEDVILISGPDVVTDKQKLPCHEQCLSVYNQLKGRTVVSQDGTKIGELNDVLVDNEGRLMGYDLGKVFIKGPVAKSKRISIEATHALGADVLVVDENKLGQ